MKRYHEKKASTPCARLLAREELSQEQRQKLQAMLSSHDPIAMRASIEAKLRALYSQRAQLQAEEDDDMAAAPERAPPSSVPARGMAGLRYVRSVASGSLDSLHSSPPSPVRSPTRKEALPSSPKTTKAKPIAVSPIVRHRAAS